MKVLYLKYIKTEKPQGSCGTGYSESDKYEVITNEGIYQINIDIWYRVYNAFDAKKVFYETINDFRNKKLGYTYYNYLDNIENYDYFFNLFLNILINRNIVNIRDNSFSDFIK